MSGEGFNKHISRRTFVKLAGVAMAFPSCSFLKEKNSFPVTITGSAFKTGHLLRENKFPEPAETVGVTTLIVGGGISGLSAARWLKKNGLSDFKLLELDTEAGGNSKGGENAVSRYPFAAHYLPIPNEKFQELIDFLHEHAVITGFDQNGLPVYNDYYICFEPEERLFYRGLWQEGLPPKTGLIDEETAELARFMKEMDRYKEHIGSDKRKSFTIPLELSSTDPELMKLDGMTMAEYLERENYKTPFIRWYLDYCCKDDFGTSIKNTSAWAACHYFACRTGKASNADASDVLTWPEGNNFLAKKLLSEVQSNVEVQMLTYKIEQVGEEWHSYVYDVRSQKSIKYVSKSVILATPQFVNKKILSFQTAVNWDEFSYYPWIVANITIHDKKHLNGGVELCWDNVLYNSTSLGYVNACHQSVNVQEKTVLTYYYNFSERAAREERQEIYSKDENYWKNFILEDLRTAHPHIAEHIESVEVNVLGHGMISPVTGFRTSASRAELAGGHSGLYFAHSDISGISIFEQAFYRGICAAKQALQSNQKA